MRYVQGEDMVLFVSSKDSKGKRDASGAFVPEARRFQKTHNVPDRNIVLMDCTKKNPASSRRDQVLSTLHDFRGLGAVCFYGHGWPQGIQFGFKKQHCRELAESIANASTNDVVVPLFACLTAENDVRDTGHGNVGPGTDGGFADTLRDDLVREGITNGRIDGHKTAGHATWNPYVVRFLCAAVDNPEYGAQGGSWIVPPGSSAWKKWVRALRDTSKNLRVSFPFLDRDEILTSL